MKFRSVLRHVREHGIRRTGRYARARAGEILWRGLDARYDRRHNVDTAGLYSFDPATVVGGTVANCNYYEPIPPAELRRLIDGLDIHHDSFIFVDVGSGRGRALLVAAEYPFRRVVGVEFAREFHEAARANIRTYRGPRRCREVDSIHEDATRYVWPEEPAVLFFYSPFQPPLLRTVLGSLLESLRRAPRPTWIVYGSGIPECIEIMRGCGLEVFDESRMRLGPFSRAAQGRTAIVLRSPGVPGDPVP